MSVNFRYSEIKLFRYFSYLVMVCIVFTLCFIALPKTVTDSLVAKYLPIDASSEAGQAQIPKNDKNKLAIAATHSQTPKKVQEENSQTLIDVVREDQKQIFSMIAAIAALLVFLGFKGLDSFLAIHQSAHEAAEDAKEFKKFLEGRYRLDGKAGYMVTHALIRRELADLCADMNMPQHATNFLAKAKAQLLDAIPVDSDHEESYELKSRAYGVLGNVYYSLGNYEEALYCQNKIIKLETRGDRIKQEPSARLKDAYYNYACYASKMADQFDLQGNHHEASRFGAEAIGQLKKYLIGEDSSPLAKLEITEDLDFEYLRRCFKAEYDCLVK